MASLTTPEVAFLSVAALFQTGTVAALAAKTYLRRRSRATFCVDDGLAILAWVISIGHFINFCVMVSGNVYSLSEPLASVVSPVLWASSSIASQICLVFMNIGIFRPPSRPPTVRLVVTALCFLVFLCIIISVCARTAITAWSVHDPWYMALRVSHAVTWGLVVATFIPLLVLRTKLSSAQKVVIRLAITLGLFITTCSIFQVPQILFNLGVPKWDVYGMTGSDVNVVQVVSFVEQLELSLAIISTCVFVYYPSFAQGASGVRFTCFIRRFRRWVRQRREELADEDFSDKRFSKIADAGGLEKAELDGEGRMIQEAGSQSIQSLYEMEGEGTRQELEAGEQPTELPGSTKK